MIRLWYLICLLFLLFNINILIEESYQIVYEVVNQNEPIKYLVCLNLKEMIIDKTRINLNEIKKDVNCNLRWIQKNEKDIFGQLISNNTIEIILNEIEFKDYLIYRDRICFIFSNKEDNESLFYLLYRFPIDLTYLIFNSDTFSFQKLNYFFAEFNQITVQHKEYPYSNCRKNYYSNFECLNDRIKKKQRLSRYYYGSDDNGSIELNYEINHTIIDNELKTIKQCNQIDCKINIFYPANRDLESIVLKSFFYIPKFDFYFQLIGLIILFLNISIYKLIIKFINFFDLRQMNLIKLKYLKLNYLILLINLICLSILVYRSMSNFIAKRDHPSMKKISINSIKSDLSIVICLDVNKIRESDCNLTNRSLLEIEKDTDNGLNIALKDIYLEFLNKKMPTKWQLESKLIAFKFLAKNLVRCFQLRIFWNESEYQSIFSITKLIIEFNKNKKEFIYILTDNEIFNFNSYLHNKNLNFRMRIVERSRLNKLKKCKIYNLIDNNCTNKWNCINRCLIRNTYNQFKKLIRNLVIDKQYFTENEWANLFIESFSYDNLSIFDQVISECEDKYLKFNSCIDIKIEEQSKTIPKFVDRNEIDLNYEVIYYKEDEVSIFKLLLDLLNIQINLFGLNFYKCSFMILSLIKLNLKFTKIFKLLINLICSIGFIYHLWSIYNEIINIEIIYSEHYELINTIQMPDLIFCFNINQAKIDPNYKLTYEYLDKITEELIENNIFNRIEYLNSSNKWIKLDNKTSFKDNNLEIRIFYYLDRKCFKIILNIEYNKNQFEFNNKMNGDDGLVLKIFLNRIYLDDENFYFFTKTKSKFQFSRIQQLNLKGSSGSQLFRIKHELIKRDKFELIKNPLSSDDQNDLDKFFNKFMNYFETKLNMVTFELPFEKTNLNFKKEINDNLFIQLYNQQKDQFNTNPKYYRLNSYNYLNIDSYENLIADFKFSLSFYRKIIAVSNKISLIKLIINLLNVLSFWFNLGILDLYNYLIIIKLLSVKFYKLLIKIKN